MTNKSTDNAGGIEPSKAPAAGQKARIRGLADLDGRTGAAKAAKALVGDLTRDLGGEDRLSAAERELVQRAALAAAMLRDMEANWLSGRGIDVPAYTTLSNSQARILKMLGLEIRARDVTPDLHRYLEAKAVTPAPAATNAPAKPARATPPRKPSKGATAAPDASNMPTPANCQHEIELRVIPPPPYSPPADAGDDA